MNAYANTLVERNEDGYYFVVETNEVWNTAGDGLWSDVAKAVKVNGLGMFVCTDEDVGDGDFYVSYDESTWDNRKDGLIYTDKLFLAMLREKMFDVLYGMGVEDDTAHKLVADIHYSEQGMQDDGRVSLDAFELADFLRTYYK